MELLGKELAVEYDDGLTEVCAVLYAEGTDSYSETLQGANGCNPQWSNATQIK